MLSTPSHGVATKADDPYRDRDQIPQWNQPSVRQHITVFENMPADHQRNRQPETQRDCQRGARPERSAAGQYRQ